jgi:hypothetical protein
MTAISFHTCNVCTPVCYKNIFRGKCFRDRNFAAVFLQLFIDFALVSSAFQLYMYSHRFKIIVSRTTYIVYC